jgi:hypothetical protein
MVSTTIFQIEINSLEDQVAALQTQVAAAQAKIVALSEAEFMTAGAIEALQVALEKVTTLAPGAIANLKKSVFALFEGDDDSHKSAAALPASALLPNQLAAPELELNGESTELCCLLSDCPAEVLQGQVVEIACKVGHPGLCEGVLLEPPANLRHEGKDDRELPTRMGSVEEPAYINLVRVNDCVAYMRRLDGEIVSVYAGGNNKGKLKSWGDWLTRTNSITNGYELREAKRLDTKWEIKLTPMTLKQIDRLAACDFNKDPRSNYPDAPKRQLEKVPSNIELDNFQPGDVVSSVTVRNWSYTVLGVRDDGFLEVERIGVNPQIKSTLSPASVELVRRGSVLQGAAQEALESIQPPLQKSATVDVDDVPRGVTLTSIRDDKLVRFDVWMWAEVRVFGKIERQNKQLGSLTQTIFGIEAIRPRASAGKVFTRTLDAVAYLIAGSGYKPIPAVQHQEQDAILAKATDSSQQDTDDEF